VPRVMDGLARVSANCGSFLLYGVTVAVGGGGASLVGEGRVPVMDGALAVVLSWALWVGGGGFCVDGERFSVTFFPLVVPPVRPFLVCWWVGGRRAVAEAASL